MAMAGLAGGRMDDGVLHKLDQWQKNRHFGNWTGAVRHGGVMDEMPTFGQLERAPVNTKACGRPILEAGLIRELDLVGSTGWVVSGCAVIQELTASGWPRHGSLNEMRTRPPNGCRWCLAAPEEDNDGSLMSSQKRVLVSEGSSLSAREAVTALGMAGHQVGVCDPNPICIGRFSRFVTHYYPCPAIGKDPWAYLDAVLRLLSDGCWDVLFPTHEQAFLFSRERARIPSTIGLAAADFPSFLQIQGKATLVRTLEHLSIPQPSSRVIRTQEELLRERRFPFYLKADYATASTAVWKIRSAEELKLKSAELGSKALMNGDHEFVVQAAAEGALERVQAVFDTGRLVGIHGYRQTAEGLSGGDIAKLSVNRSNVRDYVVQLGDALRWHGALSLDYILPLQNQVPLFIDANPRLVEPMNATFGGVNLADLLVRVSTGEPVTTAGFSGKEVRTHMLLMALLSKAAARTRRLDIIFELMRAIARRGFYTDSQEELLPLRIDFESLFPLAYVIARLLLDPMAATALSLGSITSYSLTPDAARQIADLSTPDPGPDIRNIR
jgi:hypothetical protein